MSDKCYKYDPIADTWVESGTMSGYKSESASDYTDSFGLAMAQVAYYQDPLEVTQDGINFELLAEPPNTDVREGDSGCLVILDDKNVFLAGGGYGSTGAYIYNKDANAWRAVSDMTKPRTDHSCGLVPSRSGSGYDVVVVGGDCHDDYCEDGTQNSIEIFSIETETWRDGNDMSFGIRDAQDIRVNDTFVMVGGRVWGRLGVSGG